MTKCLLMVAAVTTLWTGAAMADGAPPPVKGSAPTKWTCADFLSFDEVTRPKIVYWSEGFARKEKTANVAFDVDRDDSLVPQLIEDCTKEPHASYWTTMKRRFMLD